MKAIVDEEELMAASKRPKISPDEAGRYSVAFQFDGSTFQTVHFETREEAEAHAESFVSPEPKYEDEGLTERLDGSAIDAEGE